MSQSKSILMPFIIIAAVLFGGALAWKAFQPEPEPIIIEKPAVTPKKEKAKKKVTQHDDITIIEYDEQQADKHVVDEAAMEERKRLAPVFMDFAIRYDSEKKVLTALKKLHDLGKNEKFNDLVKFAERNFPNLEIPTFD